MRQVKGASVGHLLFGFFAGLGVHECEDDQLALGLAVKVAVFVLEELVAYLDLEGYLDMVVAVSSFSCWCRGQSR